MPVVIFDLYRTLYDPDKDALLPGVIDTLQRLKDAGMRLYVVTRDEGNRSDILLRLQIRDFFHGVLLVPSKSREVFQPLCASAGEVYVIGDRIKEEILYGNQCKAKTIWFKNGKFASEGPSVTGEEPWRTVTNMSEIVQIILKEPLG